MIIIIRIKKYLGWRHKLYFTLWRVRNARKSGEFTYRGKLIVCYGLGAPYLLYTRIHYSRLFCYIKQYSPLTVGKYPDNSLFPCTAGTYWVASGGAFSHSNFQPVYHQSIYSIYCHGFHSRTSYNHYFPFIFISAKRPGNQKYTHLPTYTCLYFFSARMYVLYKL